MTEAFNRKNFDAILSGLSERYEKSAPTVSEWAEWLFTAKDHEITLADVHLASEVWKANTQPNYAANAVYHLSERLGRVTTGHAGF